VSVDFDSVTVIKTLNHLFYYYSEADFSPHLLPRLRIHRDLSLYFNEFSESGFSFHSCE
jgi:hypothetical protein